MRQSIDNQFELVVGTDALDVCEFAQNAADGVENAQFLFETQTGKEFAVFTAQCKLVSIHLLPRIKLMKGTVSAMCEALQAQSKVEAETAPMRIRLLRMWKELDDLKDNL